MSYATLARPYAKALFREAQLNDQLEDWSLALQYLSLIVTSQSIKTLYNSPKVALNMTRTLICNTLKVINSSLLTTLNHKLDNLLSILQEKKRLPILKEISILYHRLLAAHQKTVEVKVISAHVLSKTEKTQLHASLEARFSSKVCVQFLEDKTLIGGALIKSDHWVLDGSIAGKLARLKKILKN